jgi:uncharacterized protein YndB with AHSA1/START domain
MPHSTSSSIVVRAPRAKVWEALIQPEIVRNYFFGTNLVTDWKVGSPLFFRGEWDGKSYEDRGTVLSFLPQESLSFDYWSSFSGHEDRPELRHVVRYELTETPEGVRVSVEQSNVDTKERAEHSRENWTKVLEGMKKVVEEAASGR